MTPDDGTVDRAALATDLERARVEFHRLLAEAERGDVWAEPTRGTRWTNEQLLFHMVFGYMIVQRLLFSSCGCWAGCPILSAAFSPASSMPQPHRSTRSISTAPAPPSTRTGRCCPWPTPTRNCAPSATGSSTDPNTQLLTVKSNEQGPHRIPRTRRPRGTAVTRFELTPETSPATALGYERAATVAFTAAGPIGLGGNRTRSRVEDQWAAELRVSWRAWKAKCCPG